MQRIYFNQEPADMIQDNTFYKSLADYRIPKETRFAPVVPLSIAAELSDSNTLGNYHLLLAHDVLANPREYAEIYGNKGYTILMDNSLIELGYAMPIEEVLDAANIVGGQYIILPDTLKQADTTIQQVLNAYIVWKGIPAAKKHGVSLLPVIQGMSMREQFDCLFAFSNIPDVKGMCVPRVIADTYGTRKYLIEKVTRTFNVHMLGFSDNLMDDIACARMPGVVGIDSAVPIRLGLRARAISLDEPQDAGKRECYWDEPYGLEQQHPCDFSDTDRLGLINYNLNAVRKWISK